MQQFKINDYITLRLEGRRTNIYVSNEKFLQCKYLLIDVPIDDIVLFDNIKSIDELSPGLNNALELEANGNNELHAKSREFEIPPEVEFWGHCSNLQVWYEHDYNTHLIHSNLAFPLLKRLTEANDPLAKKIFKEEVVKRLEERYVPTLYFLLTERYLDYFNDEEFETILNSIQNLDDKKPDVIIDDLLIRLIVGKDHMDLPYWTHRETLVSLIHPNLNLLSCLAKFGGNYRISNFDDWVVVSLREVKKHYTEIFEQKLFEIKKKSKAIELENLLDFIEDVINPFDILKIKIKKKKISEN